MELIKLLKIINYFCPSQYVCKNQRVLILTARRNCCACKFICIYLIFHCLGIHKSKVFYLAFEICLEACLKKIKSNISSLKNYPYFRKWIRSFDFIISFPKEDCRCCPIYTVHIEPPFHFTIISYPYQNIHIYRYSQPHLTNQI